MSGLMFNILVANLDYAKIKWGVAGYDVLNNSYGFISEIKECSLTDELIDSTGVINNDLKLTLARTIKDIVDDYISQDVKNVRKAFISAPIEISEHFKQNKSLLQELLTIHHIRPKLVPEYAAIGGYFDEPNTLIIEASDKTTLYMKLNNEVVPQYITECIGYQDLPRTKEQAKDGLMSSIATSVGLKVRDFIQESNDPLVVRQRLRDFLNKTKARLFSSVTKNVGLKALDLWEKYDGDKTTFIQKLRGVIDKENLSLDNSFFQGVRTIIGLGLNPAEIMREELFEGEAGLPKTVSQLIKESDIYLRKEIAGNVKIFGEMINQEGFIELVDEKLKPIIQGYDSDFKPEIIVEEHVKLKGLLNYLSARV